MKRYFGLHTLEGEWHALLPRYLYLAPRIEGAHVLDIGCGNGLGASLLRELGAAHVQGIDHRPAVLELARMKHAKDHLEFHVMLWEELGFGADTFDMVLCLDPSSPVTDPNLLREVRRVLKPNGEYICAVERQTITGLEALLPRYGYSNNAEQVHVHQPSQPVPQIGELRNHFQSVHVVTQRPQYGYAFEETKAEEQDDSPRQAQTPAHTDRRLVGNEADMAGVELWICGQEVITKPLEQMIHLPYYSIVERLKSANTPEPLSDREQTWHFGEIVDNHGTLQESTGVFEARDRLDEDPTQVRKRPNLEELAKFSPAQEHQSAQLDAHIQQMHALHQRMQSDFERLLFEARTAFEQREGFLTQLTQAMLDEQKRQVRRANINPEMQRRATIGHTAAFEARIEELEGAVEVLINERDALRKQVRQLRDELQDQLRDTFERDEPISEPVDYSEPVEEEPHLEATSEPTVGEGLDEDSSSISDAEASNHSEEA